MPKLRPLYVFGAGLILSLAVAGCSGDSNSSASAATGGSGSGASINIAESAAKLGELDSFRFSGSASLELEGGLPQSSGTGEEEFGAAILSLILGSLKDVKVEGAFAAPDQMELKIKFGSQEIGFVQIGDKAWSKFFGPWESVEAEEMGLDMGLKDGLSLDNIAIDTVPPEVLNAAKVTKEKVNGMDTSRYSFDKAALESLAEDVSAGSEVDSANLDIWLTDDGVPVKLALKLAGKDEDGKKISLQGKFNLKDLNSNITIKPPI